MWRRPSKLRFFGTGKLVQILFALLLVLACGCLLQPCDAATPGQYKLVQTIVDPPTDCGQEGSFGYFVTMSGDGKTAAVSCPMVNEKTGLVVVLKKEVGSGNWTQETILNGTAKSEGAREGVYLAISKDGNTLAASAPWNSPTEEQEGSVFVYVRSAGTWTQQAQIENPSHIFHYYFGDECTLSADGNTLAVLGAFSDNVHIFVRDGTNWNFQTQLFSSHGFNSILQVTLSSDGKMVGLHTTVDGDTTVRLFEFYQYAGATWNPLPPTSMQSPPGTYAWKFTDEPLTLLAVYPNFFSVLVFNGTAFEEKYRSESLNPSGGMLTSVASEMTGEYVMLGAFSVSETLVMWRKSTNPLTYEVSQNITIPGEGWPVGYSTRGMSDDGELAILGLGTASNVPYPGQLFFYERKEAANDFCNPKYGINKATCKNRMKACAKSGIQMKWAGAGCRRKTKPRIAGDGGCQCKGYCGYTCKKACRKDKECKWMNGLCHVKGSGEVGTPMLVCVS